MSKANAKPGNDTDAPRDEASYAKKATAAAHDAVDRVGEKAGRAEERLRDAAEDVQRRSHDARDRARGLGDEATLTARTYLHEHPVASLAVAFGVGMLVSAFMRRR